MSEKADRNLRLCDHLALVARELERAHFDPLRHDLDSALLDVLALCATLIVEPPDHSNEKETPDV